MRRIYEEAESVLIWLGPDTEEHPAEAILDSIMEISDFLCEKLGVSLSDLSSTSNVYHDLVFKHRDKLPLPNECEFSTDIMWRSLVWFYAHTYFTRVWVIQEVSANKERWLHLGLRRIEWDRVDIVAGYMILETAFSKSYGFSEAYCWWASSISELIRQPKAWLCMLYLASSYSCLDTRDAIYGLRGLMEFSEGGDILRPDYSKSIVEVYRDSVEASFVNFKKTDVLLYLTGNEEPSWIPRWVQPMFFRNPFRFGKPVPWTPAGNSNPVWDIDRESNILYLSGYNLGALRSVESYNERFFGNAMLDSEEGRDVLKGAWKRILKTLANGQPQENLNIRKLTAAATAFSFGLDQDTNPGDEHQLVRNFVAYLRMVVDEEVYTKYISPEIHEKAPLADGHAFGKPIWDFEYPESSFFITELGLIGCAVSATKLGDILSVPLGSTYPIILRPDGDHFHIRGYAFVHGIMHGERQGSEEQIFKIH